MTKARLERLLIQAYRAGASGGMSGRERSEWLRAVKKLISPPQDPDVRL